MKLSPGHWNEISSASLHRYGIAGALKETLVASLFELTVDLFSTLRCCHVGMFPLGLEDVTDNPP